MNESDIPYLMKRARAHRLQAAAAKCTEARLIHRRFVKNYQRLLADIRRAQGRECDECGCSTRNADSGDCEGRGTDTTLDRPLMFVSQGLRRRAKSSRRGLVVAGLALSRMITA